MDMTYSKAIKNADALKALGQERVYLFDRSEEPPWFIATSCKKGCSVRLGITTSVEFSGQENGLQFYWSIDLEDRDANGKSTTRIDIDRIKATLTMLCGAALVQFREYLSDVSAAVRKQADEYQEVADRQYRDAAVLRDLMKD